MCLALALALKDERQCGQAQLPFLMCKDGGSSLIYSNTRVLYLSRIHTRQLWEKSSDRGPYFHKNIVISSSNAGNRHKKAINRTIGKESGSSFYISQSVLRKLRHKGEKGGGWMALQGNSTLHRQRKGQDSWEGRWCNKKQVTDFMFPKHPKQYLPSMQASRALSLLTPCQEVESVSSF